MGFERELSAAQLQAVTHGEGPLRVVGGPGGGKTRVLTYRIAWLVRQAGVPAEQILALTFTNKAAEEMRQRIVALLGEEVPVRAGTIHSWAYQFLCIHRGRERGGLLGAWNPNQKNAILADARQYFAWQKAVQAAGVDLAPAFALHLVSRAKNDGVGLAEFERRAAETDDPKLAATCAAWREYERWKLHARVLDFDDLLLFTAELLGEPAVQAAAHVRYRWVLLDESQDVNRVQWCIVRRLCPPPRGNLTVVGDYDQSIYGWRGADATAFLELVRDYEAVTVKLETNYRSTEPIVRAANRLIEANRAREDKTLRAAGGHGPEPAVAVAADPALEAARGVEQIRRWLAAGHRPADVAVLVRAWWLTRAFEERLLKGRIPYRVIGGPGFFLRREVQDLLAYFTLAVDPTRDDCLQRILNVPRRFLGAQAWRAIERHALQREMPAFAALSDPSLRWPRRGMRDRAMDLFALLQRLRQFDGTSRELLERVLARTGYLRYLEQECEPGEYQNRRDNIEEMLQAAEEHPEPADFVFYAEQLAAERRAEADERGVTLTSIHGAKGLEFPCVIVAGCAERVLPHERGEDLEEERRLAYVAITRAERELLLTCATEYRHRATVPSRFLYEAGLQVPETEDSEDPSVPRAEDAPRSPEEPLGPPQEPPGEPDVAGGAAFRLLPLDRT